MITTRCTTVALALCVALLCPLFARADPKDEALLMEYLGQGHAARFSDPIMVWMGGKGRLEGQYYIETVLDEIRKIVPQLGIKIVSSGSQANLRVHLTDSHEEWLEAIAQNETSHAPWQEKKEHVRGFTSLILTPDNRISRADVVLHLALQTSGGQKLWVVRHEFMHAQGVLGHPRNHTDSVLNSKQAQHNKNSLFSDADKAVLQALYAR